jgi:hypothetical protein
MSSVENEEKCQCCGGSLIVEDTSYNAHFECCRFCGFYASAWGSMADRKTGGGNGVVEVWAKGFGSTGYGRSGRSLKKSVSFLNKQISRRQHQVTKRSPVKGYVTRKLFGGLWEIVRAKFGQPIQRIVLPATLAQRETRSEYESRRRVGDGVNKWDKEPLISWRLREKAKKDHAWNQVYREKKSTQQKKVLSTPELTFASASGFDELGDEILF